VWKRKAKDDGLEKGLDEDHNNETLDLNKGSSLQDEMQGNFATFYDLFQGEQLLLLILTLRLHTIMRWWLSC
jgi:hypothetical protein